VLRKLENASVATTSNAILEQSDTFVFKDGKLVTFDGDICTMQDSPFGDEIEGSIVAGDFLKMLQRFPDEVLKVTGRASELVIKGKRRQAGVKMMAEVLLPFDDVPVPSKFKKVPEGMKGKLIQAAQVCGKDETAPKTTHVHIAKDRIEATDSFRVFRAEAKTNMPRPVLVHAQSLIAACRFELKKMTVSKEGWFHVMTEDGMLVSILCCADEYYASSMMDQLLDVVGEEVKLPANLPDILSRAEVMDTPSLSIGGWDSQVTISLEDNVLTVASRKEEGWFRERQKVKYNGPAMTFSIHPAFLKELVDRTSTVTISDRQIKVEVNDTHFTAALESGGDE